MTRTSIALASAALAVASACAPRVPLSLQLDPTPPPTEDLHYDSGLRVIVQEDPSVQRLSIATVVGAGHLDDPPGKEGLAHLAEHLTFRGLHNGQSLQDRLERVGGVFNAWTAIDTTTYLTLAPASALEAILRIEASRLSDPLAGVTDEDLAREREIVRAEFLERTQGAAGDSIVHELRQSLFAEGHPYREAREETQASLEAITLDDVRAFMTAHYRPDNVTIAVRGDVDPADARAIVERALNAELRDAPEPSAPKKHTDARPAPLVDRIEMASRGTGLNERAIIHLAWALPATSAQEETALALALENIEFRIAMGLLPREMWRPARAEDLDCSLIRYRLSTVAHCVIVVAPGQETTDILQRALEGVGGRTRFDGELVAIPAFLQREGYLSAVLRASQDPAGALQLARFAHFHDAPDSLPQELDRLAHTDALAVRNLLDRYLNVDRAAAFVLEPAASPPRMVPLTRAALDHSTDWSGAIASTEIDPWFAARSAEDVRALAALPAQITTREITLDNGLRVSLIRLPHAPVAQATIYFGGGPATTQPRGLPWILSTRHGAPDPIRVGGQWLGHTYEDGRSLGVTAAAGNWKAAVYLLAERVQTTRLTYHGYRKDLTVMELRKAHARLLQSREGWLEVTLWGHLLGGHPLGEDFEPAALESVGGRDLRRWLWNAQAPANARLVVVGDFELDAAEAETRTHWAAWRHKDRGAPLPGLPLPPIEPAGRSVTLGVIPDAPQTQVTVACRVDATASPSESAVLQALVQRDLDDLIRERTGVSYGMDATVYRWPGTAVLRLTTHVRTSEVRPMLEATTERLAAIGDGQIAPSALERARWAVARHAYEQWSTVSALTAAAIDAHRFERPLSSLSERDAQLAGVTAARVAPLLAPCVGREAMVLVGPEDALETQLEGTPFEPQSKRPLFETPDAHKSGGAADGAP